LPQSAQHRLQRLFVFGQITQGSFVGGHVRLDVPAPT
jgi:hypothetical protein